MSTTANKLQAEDGKATATETPSAAEEEKEDVIEDQASSALTAVRKKERKRRWKERRWKKRRKKELQKRRKVRGRQKRYRGGTRRRSMMLREKSHLLQVAPSNAGGDAGHQILTATKGSFTALIYGLTFLSISSMLGSWTAAIGGWSGSWLPRCLFNVQAMLVLLHLSVTSEEGVYPAFLWYFHADVCAIGNGILGFAFIFSTPAKVAAAGYVLGAGWHAVFTTFLLAGTMMLLITTFGRGKAMFTRTDIITIYRDRIGDFAVDSFQEGAGALLFQLLTIISQVSQCAADASRLGQSKNGSLTTNSTSKIDDTFDGRRMQAGMEDAICSPFGYAAFGSNFYTLWIFFMTTWIMSRGYSLRKVLTGDVFDIFAVGELFLSTLAAAPLAGVLIISGFTRGVGCANRRKEKAHHTFYQERCATT